MNRSGSALVFALLILAAVQLLTLSSLSLATHENYIADAQLRGAQARRRAESALQRLRTSWDLLDLDTLRIGATVAVPAAAGVTVEVVRISNGLYHSTAIATVGKSIVRREAVLRTLDAGRALRELNEAIAAAGPLVLAGAQVAIEDSSSCSARYETERPPALITVASRKYAIGILDVRVDSAHAVMPAGYAGAGTRWEELEDIADIIPAEPLTLPVTDSTAAGFPLIYAPGDLTVSGAGVGILFVAGNLTLEANAEFYGIVIVRGNAIIKDGARIDGALRVQGSGVTAIGAAAVTYSRCVCARVILQAPSAARLIRSRRLFIPAFPAQ